jgi:hypothetical protein
MSGKTEKRDCLNSSNFALVSPLAFHWITLRLLGGNVGKASNHWDYLSFQPRCLPRIH